MAAQQVRDQAVEARLSAEVVILGNGISGITAALRLRQLLPDVRITVISEETELFFSRTALMYVYMRQLQFKDTVVYPAAFYRRQRIDLVRDSITALDLAAQKIHGTKSKYSYDYLLLATGSRPRMPGLSNEQLPGVQGLYTKADLEKLEAYTKKPLQRAVIAGGGLIGVELAEMLKSRKIPVTMLVREPLYYSHILPREEADLVTREVARHVELRFSTTLAEIKGIKAVEKIVTSAGETIGCSLLGLTMGVEPRAELARSAGLTVKRGIVTDAFLRTSDARVFAAGDAAQVTLPGGECKVQQIWYTGRLQGEVAGTNLAAAITAKAPTAYEPGIYFNSARFFTLDYQTYGTVPASANSADSLLWQQPSSNRLLRISYDPKRAERPVTGFNALGVRLLHRVCEAWIRDKTPLASVLRDFNRAVFDPEFSPQYVEQLRKLLWNL